MIDTEALRSKILDLAIRGKLTEQLPEDGSAEDLYAKIQEEKAQLLKEGKIKKEKALPEITEDEIPFEIPKNWKWVHLGELFAHNTGKALNSSDKEGVLLEYITTSNMYWDHFELNGLKKMYFKNDEIKKCTIRKGDLLICEGGDIGRSAIWNFDYDMRIQNHIHRLRPFILDLSSKFYYYVMRIYKDNKMINGQGIGLQGFSSRRVHSLLVPLPPFEEQKRIIDKVNDIFEKIDEIENLQSQYATNVEVLKNKLIDAGIRGKLTEQFPEDGDAEALYNQIQNEKARLIKEGKIKKEKPLPDISEDEMPFEIPKSWKWVRIGKVINEVIVPQRDKPSFSGNIPWCRIEDRDVIYLNGTKYGQYVSEETIREMNLRIFPVGTVLSACSGASIGTILVNTVECCTNQTFNGLVCNDLFYNWYLFWFLKSEINRLKSMGSGSAMAYISQDKIRNMLIPLPPIAEQRRIVEKIDALLDVFD